jgi:hypothetical protein
MPVISTIAAATARAFGAFKSAAGGAVDEFFDYVTLLLHGDGTNGAQNNTFLDSSTNNFTITRNGNTTQGTFSPFSQTGWSNYFGESGANCLQFANNVALQMGTSDFTIEGWFYPTGGGTERTWYAQGLNSAGGLTLFIGTGGVRFRASGQTDLLYTGTISGWTHIAFIRSGTTRIIYVNGVSVATDTLSFNNNDATTLEIGAPAKNASDAFRYYGYISNARIVKGTAVYTSNFTPSTTPLTAISGTSLLTCQSNRFRDASTNNFAITVSGSPSVQAFSPFAPTAAYSAATVGGSGYFDGSGDYLTFAPGSAFAFGTGDFTVEWWMNTNGVTLGSPGIVEPVSNGSYWAMRFVGTTFYYQSAAGITTLTNVSIPTSNQSAWTHMAVVRISGTTKIYANGVQVQSVADTTNYTGTVNYQIGKTSDPNANVYSGWLTDVRVVKGTAVYTAAFTPPTAPLTAITNTSLLLNFTNGGIIDNTAKNVLETVGNAQISTSVKKFGTGSLAFDGSGDDLRVIDNAGLVSNFGTGNFTIEFWIYANSWGAFNNIIDFRKSTDYMLLIYKSGGLVYYNNGGDQISGGSLSTATWHHIALTRSGTSTKLFINGTQSGSTYTDSTNYPSQGVITIGGRNDDAGNPFNGYIDDIRITKGIARYTTTFTPPTAAFADQ